jgi:hypothetical protein
MTQRKGNQSRQDRFENQTYVDKYGQDMDDGLSLTVRMLMSILSVLPCVFLAFYAIGWWQVRMEGLDTWDNIMTSFAFMAGVMNFLIINIFLSKRWG